MPACRKCGQETFVWIFNYADRLCGPCSRKPAEPIRCRYCLANLYTEEAKACGICEFCAMKPKPEPAKVTVPEGRTIEVSRADEPPERGRP